MKKFKNLHYWLIIPFLIAFFGFFFTYWSIFTQVPFYKHVHGITATLWFLLIIVQPFLYQKNNMQLHRTLGIIGIFLAGGVVFSSMQIIPNNLKITIVERELGYIFVLLDFISLIGFSNAVIQAILNKKDIDVHARFMISTVLWILLPALSRLFFFLQVPFTGFPPPVSFRTCLHIATVLTVIAMAIIIAIDYKKHRRFFKAYTSLGITNLFLLITMEYFGAAPWWRALCDMLIENE